MVEAACNPLVVTDDTWEAYMMGEAAKRYKVVTQMGDQVLQAYSKTFSKNYLFK